MKPEEITRIIIKDKMLFTILTVGAIIGFAMVFASFIVLIWFGWSLFWKLFLTGLFLNLSFRNFEKQAKRQMLDAVEKALKALELVVTNNDYLLTEFEKTVQSIVHKAKNSNDIGAQLDKMLNDK